MNLGLPLGPYLKMQKLFCMKVTPVHLQQPTQKSDCQEQQSLRLKALLYASSHTTQSVVVHLIFPAIHGLQIITWSLMNIQKNLLKNYKKWILQLSFLYIVTPRPSQIVTWHTQQALVSTAKTIVSSVLSGVPMQSLEQF